MAEPPSPPARQPASVPAAEVPGISTLVGIVTAVVAVAGLYFARDVLIPITLAILLSFVLAPIVDLLRKVWVPRAALPWSSPCSSPSG
jgi:predicted PurR-regulated permease PerM